jgi:hypothetical protein
VTLTPPARCSSRGIRPRSRTDTFMTAPQSSPGPGSRVAVAPVSRRILRPGPRRLEHAAIRRTAPRAFAFDLPGPFPRPQAGVCAAHRPERDPQPNNTRPRAEGP